MAAARPKISDRQRRAMLVRRHLLAPSVRATSVKQVAEALVGLHATEPTTVFLSVAARMNGATPRAVEKALYEDRSLVRMLCMRRTVFVVPKELAPVVEASTARTVAARERAALTKILAGQLGHDAAWLDAIERDLLAALADLGEADATQIADAVSRLKEQITISPGETRVRINNKVLTVLAAEGRIRRGSPHGTWASAKFRWTLAEPHPGMPADEARVELATRYLRAFGPATLDDIKWWTGWNLTDTRNALAGSGAIEADLDHATGYVLRDDPILDLSDRPERPGGGATVSLLPTLDPTAMGWRDRDWYLDPAHTGDLFDRQGNIGPTLWCDGRVIGGWGQHEDGHIITELLTSTTDRRIRTAIEAEADRLTEFLADVRIRPHLRTPLVRRLQTIKTAGRRDAP
ncbi:winged helix DNA-binding domain-containing protein [Streptomyces sp. NPDC056670]|uniref:winged helix DNA-binding domain-containing protein n=1 Tax=Streptomyces sp. NPDC056670 TaxID=3345904 RepID=UPI0036A6EBDD